MSELLTSDTATAFASAVERTADLLRKGEVVALPTETVYGLAANALDPAAVSKIFELKGRPLHNPIIVHVSSMEMARRCVCDWPDLASKLARSFWPGPLTLVLRRSPEIPDLVTAGGDTVGLRWPSHPLFQAVLRECGFPLAAPSANPANRISPTNARHVQAYFGDRLPIIVDGGQCQIGIESTVIDVSESPPRVLRPGMIHEESLAAIAGELQVNAGSERKILKSPGLLEKHYSPKAKLIIRRWKDDDDLKQQLGNGTSPESIHIIAHTRIPSGENFPNISVIPHDHLAFARAIYAELHRCDQAGAELIVIEDIPHSVEWQGIADRLKRAAAK